MRKQNTMQKPVIKWCCLGFKGHYEGAGHRGTGVLVGLDFEGRPEFTLQYRAVDKGYEQSVTAEAPVGVVVDTGMRYCPWCGRDLEKWYGKVVDALYRPDLKLTY
jgi:hypothetical protein